MADLYQRAWELLLKRIEDKTGWGRNELKQAMLECLVEAGKPHPAEPVKIERSATDDPPWTAGYGYTRER